MKVKTIRVKIPGKCSALKPVPGARFTGYYCQFKPKHTGPHSWESRR